jgi:hypothetical protein
MPLHELILRQEFAGQECINRFNYVSSGTPAAATLSFGLAKAAGFVLSAPDIEFEQNSLARAIQNLQTSDVTFVDILVKDIYDVVDFYTTSFPPLVVGTIQGGLESMSPAIAYGFRSNRTRLDIKRGFKRFVGVGEGKVGPLGVIDNAVLTGPIDNLRIDLGTTLTYDDEGNTLTYRPVIVKKFKYTTSAGTTAYRYATDQEGGETAQLAQVADANVWQAYTTVRTQVSRQYGRGR